MIQFETKFLSQKSHTLKPAQCPAPPKIVLIVKNLVDCMFKSHPVHTLEYVFLRDKTILDSIIFKVPGNTVPRKEQSCKFTKKI